MVNRSTLELLAISRAEPFSYTHETGEFHFGDQKVTTGDVEIFGSPHEQGENNTTEIVQSYIDTTPYLFSYTHPVSLPLAATFVENGWKNEYVHETAKVMADVYLSLSSRFSREDRAQLLESRNFDVVLRTQPGDVTVHTLGSCACFGPDYAASLSAPYESIMEYTYHNIDSIEQKVSVMAGLGHIARRASEWIVAHQ